MKKKILIIGSIVFVLIIIITIFIFKNEKNSQKKDNNIKYTRKQICKIVYNNELFQFSKIKESAKINELTNEELANYLYYRYDNYFDVTKNKELSGDEVINLLKEVFGNEIKYTHTNLHYDNENNKYSIIYNGESNSYTKGIDYKLDINENIIDLDFCTLNDKKDNNYYVSFKTFKALIKDNIVVGLYSSYEDAKNDQNKIFDTSTYNIPLDVEKRNKEITKIFNDNYEMLKDKIEEYEFIFKVKENNLYLDSYKKK